LAKKENKFAMYHAKQALVLWIAAIIGWVAVGIISFVFAFIPVLGAIVSALVWLALVIAVLYLMILGIINAVNLREQPLPYIGQYAEKLKI
jgi:uncharacterized membrane protein